MSTQQDIYAAGSESRPPMLNKENYIPWSSHLLRYAKSRPNGKLIHNSILNGPYDIKMIPEPGDANRDINITETSHLQTDDELSDKELKQIEADDQAIQTILLGLPEDIYAAVDSCKTAQEIWLRVQQIIKGSDIRIQEKKAKLFNEWERFTSNEGESIESYYHRFLKLMNDLKRNKHFPEKIASNMKFLNNLKPDEDFLEDLFPCSSSGNPTFSSHPELTSPEVTNDIHDSEGCNDIHPHFEDNPLSGSTIYSANSLHKEFTDEFALITYPSDYDDNLQFDIESDLKEIEFLLYQGKDSSFKDWIDQTDLANLEDNFVDPILEMFTDKHTLDYSSPLIFDVYDDDFLEVESDTENVYDDPFDSKGEKIKESKLLIDELDLPCDFLPYFEYDLFNS
uniref:Uncharacterized protein n=1 Tax=Tanacetum cinerariifolium TaxID=118510 RepID=A0A6L2P0P2_TANCI|nr:hypothetical protein [Tanacetum cinerariifolium]